MSEPAGPKWCARFPTSAILDTLTPEFYRKASAFVAALRQGGATVTINATYRPPERAYLMHWACMIGGGGQDPEVVPAMAGVAIDWTCGGDRAMAKAAARAMMAGYEIAFPAALASRHTQRRAVDMTIWIPGGARIKARDGSEVLFAQTCDGTDARVVAIGKGYAVLKLASDPPHWSDDGH
jgi:hypothetical protein